MIAHKLRPNREDAFGGGAPLGDPLGEINCPKVRFGKPLKVESGKQNDQLILESHFGHLEMLFGEIWALALGHTLGGGSFYIYILY